MVKTLLLVAFLAGGLLLVQAGALPLWAWLLLTAITVFMRLLGRMDAAYDELTIDAQGVVREHGSRLRQKLREAVRWDELQRVEVRTRETGPRRDEMLFLLFGAGENGVAVPGHLALRHDLPAQLRQRLPDFRDDQLALATAAGERATFLLWQKSR
jgi:hypothetical protein